jgi:hypothetical protein
MHIPEELQKKNIFNRLSFNQSKGVSDKKDQFLSKYFDELRKPMCILFGNYVVNSDFIILKKDATYTDYELFTDFNSDVHDYYAI